MNISDIPPKDKKLVVDIIESCIGIHGFSKDDFTRPEPSHTETNNVGWTIKLRNFPKHYFYFRVTHQGLLVKYLPNADGMSENSLNIKMLQGTPFDHIKKQAERWLKTIENNINEDKRLNSFVKSLKDDGFTQFEEIFETIEPEIDNDGERTLTLEEVQNVRQFLTEFNEMVQRSETLPTETKSKISEIKETAESALKKTPTKRVIRWIGKLLNDITVKLVTDSNYRREIGGYLTTSYDKIKHFVTILLE